MTDSDRRLDAATPRRQLTLSDTPPDDGATPDGRSTSHAASDGRSTSHGGATSASASASAWPPDGDVVDVGGALARHDGAVAGLVAVDAARIHPGDLPGAVKRLRRARNRLEAVETSWIATVQARQAHKADGARDTATWARDELGSSWRHAKGQLAAAAKLEGLPQAKAAFTGGDISGDAATAIVKATGDERLAGRPDVEGRLVDAARRGGPDLVRKTARKLKAATDDHDRAADDADQQHRNRYADVNVRGDGTVKIDALLDQVNGEHFLTAWRPLLRDMHTNRSQLEVRTRKQRAADAFGELARRAIAEDGTIPQSAGRPTRCIVTTDLPTLQKAAGHAADARAVHTGPISAETARRIACDANIVPVVLNGQSVPIDLGRTSRQPTVGQRDCLIVRDRACRGCGAPAHLCVPHHCIHWADGGSTDLHNLVLLCFACHQLVHEGGWTVTWNPDNTATFTTPHGRTKIRPPP